MTAAGGSLGINTKFANAVDFHPTTGNESEIDEKSRVGLLRVKYAPSGVDVEKLEGLDLQVYKRALRWRRLRMVQHMLNGQRVEKCYRTRIKPNVEIWRSQSSKRAFYSGLMICGSVWSCPVCAAKITERKKLEIELAPKIDQFSKFMVTYTLQHSRGDRLVDLIADLRAGIRDMKNSRGYKSLIESLQIVGSITGLEVTISDLNGWHPHIHALVFSKLAQSKIIADELREAFSNLFIVAMQKRGRYVHAEIGVNVQSENVIASYVAKMGEGEKESKWSLAAEIAKSPVKTGHDADHFHPFELLDMYALGNMHAGRLFKEYAIAMKQKNQLRYSKGLRSMLGLDVEISDQEIAEHIEAEALIFALLESHHWQKILQHEKRSQLLEVASAGNYELLVAYMHALGCGDFGAK